MRPTENYSIRNANIGFKILVRSDPTGRAVLEETQGLVASLGKAADQSLGAYFQGCTSWLGRSIAQPITLAEAL